MNKSNDILFFKLWRNIIIKKNIISFIKIYNLNNGCISFGSLQEYSEYKYKDFIESIDFNGCIDDTFDFNQLSMYGNIKEIKFSKEIQIKFTKGMIPDTVTSLTFNELSKFNQELDCQWLPSSIKTLDIGNSGFQQDLKNGQLPNSLTDLKVNKEYYNGSIEYGSIPKLSEGSFSYILKLSDNKSRIPKSTTSLEFTGFGDVEILANEIPSNVTMLKLGNYDNTLQSILPSGLTSLELIGFNQPLQPNIFPASITWLKFERFNQPINESNLLPSNLKHLFMDLYNKPLPTNSDIKIFPESIESISFSRFYHAFPAGYLFNYKNLKSLEFNQYNQVIPDMTLPDSLTSLKFSSFNKRLSNGMFSSNSKLTTLKFSAFKKQILPNQLPQSLKTLYLGDSYYRPIESDILPNSITNLNLGMSYRAPINSSVLPKSLKVIHLNLDSNNLILDINDLPESLNSIYVPNNNRKDCLNNLEIDFILKYIKFK